MPDLIAGTVVDALDWPPAVEASDATQINNPTNTTYSAGSPVVGTTFMAPTSGRVRLIVGGGLGNSSGADRIFLAPQIFLGVDATGTEILAPTVVTRGFSAENAASGFHYGSRETILEGLVPGATYSARIMHVVSADPGAQTGDIAYRQITIVPLEAAMAADGTVVRGQDAPATAWAQDDLSQLNITSTAYIPGTPEVAVTFTAPTSGKVRITVGGGIRDNGGTDRAYIVPQVFRGPASAGAEILAPSVTNRGYGSVPSSEYAHGSRTSLLTGLVPGETYYARVVFATAGGTGTADISCREISVSPTS